MYFGGYVPVGSADGGYSCGVYIGSPGCRVSVGMYESFRASKFSIPTRVLCKIRDRLTDNRRPGNGPGAAPTGGEV